jgi:hypothetical protein
MISCSSRVLGWYSWRHINNHWMLLYCWSIMARVVLEIVVQWFLGIRGLFNSRLFHLVWSHHRQYFRESRTISSYSVWWFSERQFFPWLILSNMSIYVIDISFAWSTWKTT